MTKRKWFIHGQTHSSKTSGVSLHILCSCLKHSETNIQPWSVCSLKSAASDSHDLHCIVCEPAFYQRAAQQLISQLQGIWGFHHLQNIIAAPLYEAISTTSRKMARAHLRQTERRKVSTSPTVTGGTGWGRGGESSRLLPTCVSAPRPCGNLHTWTANRGFWKTPTCFSDVPAPLHRCLCTVTQILLSKLEQLMLSPLQHSLSAV